MGRRCFTPPWVCGHLSIRGVCSRPLCWVKRTDGCGMLQFVTVRMRHRSICSQVKRPSPYLYGHIATSHCKSVASSTMIAMCEFAKLQHQEGTVSLTQFWGRKGSACGGSPLNSETDIRLKDELYQSLTCQAPLLQNLLCHLSSRQSAVFHMISM